MTDVGQTPYNPHEDPELPDHQDPGDGDGDGDGDEGGGD